LFRSGCPSIGSRALASTPPSAARSSPRSPPASTTATTCVGGVSPAASGAARSSGGACLMSDSTAVPSYVWAPAREDRGAGAQKNLDRARGRLAEARLAHVQLD